MKAVEKISQDPRVVSIEKDNDGWWVLLKEGYEGDPGCQIIHEYTLKDIKDCLKYVTEVPAK